MELYQSACNFVKKQKAVFISDIARELDITHGNASMFSKEMEKEGLVQIIDKGIGKLVKWIGDAS